MVAVPFDSLRRGRHCSPSPRPAAGAAAVAQRPPLARPGVRCGGVSRGRVEAPGSGLAGLHRVHQHAHAHDGRQRHVGQLLRQRRHPHRELHREAACHGLRGCGDHRGVPRPHLGCGLLHADAGDGAAGGRDVPAGHLAQQHGLQHQVRAGSPGRVQRLAFAAYDAVILRLCAGGAGFLASVGLGVSSGLGASGAALHAKTRWHRRPCGARARASGSPRRSRRQRVDALSFCERATADDMPRRCRPRLAQPPPWGLTQ